MQNVAVLAAAGQAVEVETRRSRAEKFDIAIRHLTQLGHAQFPSPRFIEWTPGFLLRFRKTRGTSLEPIVTALVESGESVEPTFQGVIDALEISPATLHEIACACDHGEQSIAKDIAWDLKDAKSFPPFF